MQHCEHFHLLEEEDILKLGSLGDSHREFSKDQNKGSPLSSTIGFCIVCIINVGEFKERGGESSAKKKIFACQHQLEMILLRVNVVSHSAVLRCTS